MGSLDDVLGSAVPQGSLAKPLIIALGALLASGALFKNANTGTTPASSPTPSSPQQGGDVLGGLGGLLNQFQQGGLGDVMKSWIGPGQNSANFSKPAWVGAGSADHKSPGAENRHVGAGNLHASFPDPAERCRQAHAEWSVADPD